MHHLITVGKIAPPYSRGFKFGPPYSNIIVNFSHLKLPKCTLKISSHNLFIVSRTINDAIQHTLYNNFSSPYVVGSARIPCSFKLKRETFHPTLTRLKLFLPIWLELKEEFAKCCSAISRQIPCHVHFFYKKRNGLISFKIAPPYFCWS